MIDSMRDVLEFVILPQPDDTTCGPTCLHAVYRYYGDDLPLENVIAEIPQLEEGGTLGVYLGCHALRRGYQAKLYTFNLQVFDPTWFGEDAPSLAERLQAQAMAKETPKLLMATAAYQEFLRLGGEIIMEDLSSALIRNYLKKSTPILTGLSATYLYREARELVQNGKPDDILGFPSGHFVVLCGYDKTDRTVTLADPLPNTLSSSHVYGVELDRLKCAILLGIVTFDANMLIIEPRDSNHEPLRIDEPPRNRLIELPNQSDRWPRP